MIPTKTKTNPAPEGTLERAQGAADDIAQRWRSIKRDLLTEGLSVRVTPGATLEVFFYDEADGSAVVLARVPLDDYGRVA